MDFEMLLGNLISSWSRSLSTEEILEIMDMYVLLLEEKRESNGDC